MKCRVLTGKDLPVPDDPNRPAFPLPRSDPKRREELRERYEEHIAGQNVHGDVFHVDGGKGKIDFDGPPSRFDGGVHPGDRPRGGKTR